MSKLYSYDSSGVIRKLIDFAVSGSVRNVYYYGDDKDNYLYESYEDGILRRSELKDSYVDWEEDDNGNKVEGETFTEDTISYYYFNNKIKEKVISRDEEHVRRILFDSSGKKILDFV